MEAAVVQGGRIQRVTHPAGDLDPQDHGLQKPRAARPKLLAHRQADRDHDGGSVQDPSHVVRLDIAVVAERPVDQGGVDTGGLPALTHQAGLGPPAHLSGILHQDARGGILGVRGGEHGAQRIQQE